MDDRRVENGQVVYAESPVATCEEFRCNVCRWKGLRRGTFAVVLLESLFWRLLRRRLLG